MKINFKGLVDLHVLPSTEPLLPLYEAIVNSIQGIEESQRKDGKIEIILQREAQVDLIRQAWETDIENISIKDNGIGFTEQNFNSFETYASDFKINKGCKGVGRIMWLKAFRDVEIESVYKMPDGFYKRTFKFDIKNEVHEKMNVKDDTATDTSTIVKLNGMKAKVRKVAPKRIRTIARDIFNHCFIYFINGEMPQITITDSDETLSVNALFEEFKRENIVIENFKIERTPFQLIHTRNSNSSTSSHLLNFCAHNRTVTATNLNVLLKNINTKFFCKDGDYVYSGYIISDFLDENVNRERTDFYIENSEPSIEQQITKQDIMEKVEPLILEFLKDDICEYRTFKLASIENYIMTKNPRYRFLLKNYPDCIDNIILTDNEEKLELELFKQEQQYKLKLKQEGKDLEKQIKSTKNIKQLIDKKAEYAGKVSDMGKSSLAEYILHRKTVLDILDNNLTYSNYEDQIYEYEKNIHQIIFPMKTTSDNIDYESHNLWIIDEKLAYHYYLASDQAFAAMPVIESTSDEKPDIIIFDSPFAFTDEDRQPFRNISIIEFKRPGRNDYGDKDNPIQQVIEYMDDIIAGKVKTKDGRYIEESNNLRFFCYIICDLSDKIKRLAKQRNMQQSPDGIGYYQFLDNYKAYMEIIPYSKLIQDSKQRNKILFDKLFMQ